MENLFIYSTLIIGALAIMILLILLHRANKRNDVYAGRVSEISAVLQESLRRYAANIDNGESVITGDLGVSDWEANGTPIDESLLYASKKTEK